jgi:hypothetical protein
MVEAGKVQTLQHWPEPPPISRLRIAMNMPGISFGQLFCASLLTLTAGLPS